jgi:hypothetical protein
LTINGSYVCTSTWAILQDMSLAAMAHKVGKGAGGST